MFLGLLALPAGIGVGGLLYELGLGWRASTRVGFGVGGLLTAACGLVSIRLLILEFKAGRRLGRVGSRGMIIGGSLVFIGLAMVTATMLEQFHGTP